MAQLNTDRRKAKPLMNNVYFSTKLLFNMLCIYQTTRV